MPSLTAVVLGATGLIGNHLVQELLSDPAFSNVRILVRRPVDLSHSKLDVEVVDFQNITDFKNKLGTGDCIFCCIGTTKDKVKGDKNAYRKIDFDIPVTAARLGKEACFNTYLLVSAVGANEQAGNFYLKLKGEVEKQIKAINFRSFYAFRPSILIGRRDEFRLGETVGKIVMQALSIFLIGPLSKYKGINAAQVAEAMKNEAKSSLDGSFVLHYNEMINR